MIKYQLNDEQANKARFFIRQLQKQKRGWKAEKEKAENYFKECPNKHYLSTKKRIIDASKEIKELDKKINDFKDIIKKGYVEI